MADRSWNFPGAGRPGQCRASLNAIPPRSTSPATDAYQGAAGRAYHEVKRGVPSRALPWVHALRAAKFAPHVGPEDTVFEFGAGAGWNLARLRCARRIGCDAADFLAPDLARLGVEFVSDTAQVASDTADVVICHHALEHVLHPAEVLGELRRVSKPGGKLVLHVPWERESRYGRFRADEPNHHLHGWSAQTLGNFVAVLGWHIEQVRTRRYGYDRFAAALALRVGLGVVGFRAVRSLLIALRPLREVELVARRC